jgi:hypothetical protein
LLLTQLDPVRGNGLPRMDGFCYLLQLARMVLGSQER